MERDSAAAGAVVRQGECATRRGGDFFATVNLVGAVGLWLATSWGGVIWLLAAIAQIFVALALPGFFSMLWIGADIVLIIFYFGLMWRAGRAGKASFRRSHR